MNRSRTFSPRTLFLWASLFAVALIAAGCGNDDAKTSSATAADKDALVAAFKNTTAIKTGTMELAGKFSFAGGGTPSIGTVKLTGGGPFDVSDPTDPKVDLTIEVGVLGQVQKIGVTVVDKKTYITVNGQAIELTGDNNDSVKALTGALGPDAIARLSKQFETNVTNVKKVGSESLDGTQVTLYSADIDFGEVVKALSGEAGGGSVLGALGDPSQARNSFKAKKVEFGVDESAQVVRLIRISADIVDPSAAQGSSSSSGSFDITIKLLKADGPVNIEAPKNAVKGDQSSLGGLLGAFGGGASAGQ